MGRQHRKVSFNFVDMKKVLLEEVVAGGEFGVSDSDW